MKSYVPPGKLRILIVDDDIVDREMIRRYLKKSEQNYDISEAQTVDEGLRLYDERSFDVVLLDYRMPQRNGIEMIIELRTHTRNFGSAIIMMSSADDHKLAIACLNAGAQDFISKSDISEKRILTALVHAQTRFNLEQDLRQSYLKSKDLAERDPLTGLANRFTFEEGLRLAIANNPRSTSKLGLLLFDIDNFKNINDIHGHDYGDEVLKYFAERISSCLRPHELFCRLGGDEFALMVSNFNDPLLLSKIGHRIISSLDKPIIINNITFHIEISIGAALHPDNSSDSRELVKCADIAMYRAKNIRGSNLCYFYKQMQDEYLRRYEIEKELECAIENKQLYLAYQPIVSTQSSQLVGFEALLRFSLKNGQIVSPDEFVPIAEQNGLIIDIGIWVLKNALEQIKSWRTLTGLDLDISVNLSPVQLESNDLVDSISKYIKENNLNPNNVEFEITETALFDVNKATKDHIEAIKALGCRIALDDFGTGYSSVSHLLHFPIDTVKLDKSIMPKDLVDTNSIQLIGALVLMANALQLDIVAEGIEQDFQLDIVKNNNVSRTQGYYFMKPALPKNIEDKYFNKGAEHTKEK